MRSKMLFLAGAMLAACSAAHADTTYIYTGQDFSSVKPPYTTSDSISGQFTTENPLAANAVIDFTVPLSYSFTDGVDTLNQTDSLFTSNLFTDASGNLTDWNIAILGENSSGPLSIFFTSYPEYTPYTEVVSTTNGISTSEIKGSFSVGNAQTSITPEPSSLLLFGTGLLGVGGIVKRRMSINAVETMYR